MDRSLLAAPLARDVIVVEGPDAATYLQGQLSQDVAGMPVDATRWSLLLQPQGKMTAWLRVTREAADRFLLDVDAGGGEVTAARLSRFLLRTKAEVTFLPATGTHGWSLFTLDAAGGGSIDLGAWEPPASVFLDAPFAARGAHRRDLVAEAPFDPPPAATVVDAEVLDADRIGRAVPAMGSEITEEVIPAELGQWVIDDSVSFTKGCYTGQELVARIDSRGGNVPRHLRVLDIPPGSDGDAGPVVDVGDDVLVDGSAVGTVTSARPGLAGATVALAFVKRSVDDGATPATIGGRPATIAAR